MDTVQGHNFGDVDKRQQIRQSIESKSCGRKESGIVGQDGLRGVPGRDDYGAGDIQTAGGGADRGGTGDSGE
ncbi:hypothetical protein NSB25_08480 [Acetatifactor muris]|uniref:hypothetical protein n=1 Tax=Acetatifactor muris TaxID=879566 RepID=UPI0015593193|nr:hypothetical protein [Acetatifactor muris]MCI8801550.1 hypothetical protein [Lachnospiraceae bacterium]MCR2047311.1 hypothetical protein [Acetatifactor muris]